LASLSGATEQRLCLLLARGELSSVAREPAREFLALRFQWPLLRQFAYSQQALPLCIRTWAIWAFPEFPNSVATELRRAFGSNALRNSLLAKELARLLVVLDEAGIPAISC
jgi:hypothetical protein